MNIHSNAKMNISHNMHASKYGDAPEYVIIWKSVHFVY